MGAVGSLTRRQFVQAAGAASLGLLGACGRLPSQAPPATKVRRVGILTASPFNPISESLLTAFRDGLRDLGYVEGQNLLVEIRRPEADDQLAEPAAELVGLQPEVVLAQSSTVARAMQNATTTIPIVAAGSGTDLVAAGVVASHARPGGNVTGLSAPALAAKQLQLLQEAVPTVSRVLVLYDATNPTFGRYLDREPLEEAARLLGLQLQLAGIHGPEGLEPAFEAAAREHADGLFTSLGPRISANQARIAELAIRGGLPSIWQVADSVRSGGLLGYGPNRVGMYRYAATYVDKILKGAKPTDLPVEEPREFDFVVNLKTAAALNLTIPEQVLLFATEVIQ